MIGGALRKRWTLIAGCALAAMISGGLFQLLRPGTYVSVAEVDIAPAVITSTPASFAQVLTSEASYVTAPEVIFDVRNEVGDRWEQVRTVKAAPHDGVLRIAVSSYDPAVATESAEVIAHSYGRFLNERASGVAESQRSVIVASHERQIDNLADLNRRIDELESVGGNETLDPGLATLRADREVTLELATELQQRLELLEGLASVRVLDIEPAQLSPANIGFTRLAMLGLAVAIVGVAVAIVTEPAQRWWSRRRDRDTVDVRQEQVIDLRDAAQIIAETPHRPI